MQTISYKVSNDSSYLVEPSYTEMESIGLQNKCGQTCLVRVRVRRNFSLANSDLYFDLVFNQFDSNVKSSG